MFFLYSDLARLTNKLNNLRLIINLLSGSFRRYQRLAEAQGIVAEVRKKYADYLALCEQNLDRQTIDLPSSQNLEVGDRVAALYGL